MMWNWLIINPMDLGDQDTNCKILIPKSKSLVRNLGSWYDVLYAHIPNNVFLTQTVLYYAVIITSGSYGSEGMH